MSFFYRYKCCILMLGINLRHMKGVFMNKVAGRMIARKTIWMKEESQWDYFRRRTEGQSERVREESGDDRTGKRVCR